MQGRLCNTAKKDPFRYLFARGRGRCKLVTILLDGGKECRQSCWVVLYDYLYESIIISLYERQKIYKYILFCYSFRYKVFIPNPAIFVSQGLSISSRLIYKGKKMACNTLIW